MVETFWSRFSLFDFIKSFINFLDKDIFDI